MRTRRNNITSTTHGKIRYPIGYNYRPTPIFLDRDPDMPTTWYGWVGAFLIAAVLVLIPCML